MDIKLLEVMELCSSMNVQTLNYTSMEDKATFKCLDCGCVTEYKRASSLLKAKKPSCKGCRRLQKEEEAAKLIEETYGEGSEIIEFYWNGAILRVNMRCPKGHYGERTVSYIRRKGSVCPQCSREEVAYKSRCTKLSEEKIKTLNDRGFKMVGELFGTDTPTEFECSKGHRHLRKPKYIRDIICSQCIKEEREANRLKKAEALSKAKEGYHEEKLNIIISKNPWIAKVNTHLTQSTKHVEVVCHEGHVGIHSKGNLTISGILECGECKSLKRHNDLQLKLDHIHGGTIKMVSRFNGVNNPVTKKCLMCGDVSTVKGQGVVDGNGCINCNKNASKGEKFFRSLAINMGIPIRSQVRFDGLTGVGEGNLSYDFLIGSNTLIEIHGEQHFKPCSMGRMNKEVALAKYEIQREHDIRKKAYAEEHGYKLIVIPYYGDIGGRFKQDCVDTLESVLEQVA